MLSNCHHALASTHTSFALCPNDPKPKALVGMAPACVDSGGNCSDPADVVKLREFSKAVDDRKTLVLLQALRADPPPRFVEGDVLQ